MIAGRDEHRRAARNGEGVEREGDGLGVDALAIEQVAGDEDRVDPALDRLAHNALEGGGLLAASLGPRLGVEPSEARAPR